MTADAIPYRQIHLDFHTSPEIPAVGQCFDAAEFVNTLKKAHVNSINLFTKCHHGMYYYPSEIGTQHPSLQGFDLFGAQSAACKAAGIRVIAYTCVSWSEDWAARHPEWLMVTYDGLHGNRKPFEEGYYQWNTLCYNNPDYKKIIKAELEETWRKYHPAGFWIDIIQGHQCVCPACMAEMRSMGFDPRDRDQVIRHDRITEITFCREMYQYLKSLDKNLDIFFNSHPYALDDGLDDQTSTAEKRRFFSHVDIESLPSEQWGYSHFPVAAAYINKYDTEIAMMNGKFHFSWGDFGSLRNEKALEYECFRALAYGAKVCVGDQLHPCGRLDPVVYERIGKVFASIENKESWLHGTRPVAEIGVFITGNQANDPDSPALIEEGVYRVLQELHLPFHFLNSRDSLEGYRLLILPDHFTPDAALAARLDEFVAHGGKLLLTGDGGVDLQTGRYALSCVRAVYKGASVHRVRYLRFTGEDFADLPQIDHVLYERGCTVEPGEGETAQAMIVNPYFERTYWRFCSHRQTPPRLESEGEPGVLYGDGYAVISSPLFIDYLLNGYQVHREVLRRVIRRLLPTPVLRAELPPISEITLRKQKNNYIIHILNYVQQHKSKRLDTIESEFPVTNGIVCLKLERPAASVRLVPEGKELKPEYQDGYAVIHLPLISGHTMIEVRI